ncbi:MAG: ATP phosphoribosyltransferase [Candidatus Tectomicrobia bacterium]|uniref:ATP phosphoribosyltransferase n=1 Tax=Tectimicrobiota bacterium TaxID=2528274 RepID=A0A932M0B8_UNCTE|nr:ATP phosphoribosyltransferase [Candidatus Tectomicrobia bacterium]
MSGRLTMALPKGRNLQASLKLLRKIGATALDFPEGSRRLVFEDRDLEVNFLTLRDLDIPTYVEHGAADMGIVGKDILLEQQKDVYVPLDLKFGACRLILAKPKDAPLISDAARLSHIRVATKFPRITTEYMIHKGIQVEVIKLYGSIELAPIVGLSEWIVDLVSSGRTLAENGLVEVEEIARASARLIVNRASHKTKYDQVETIIAKLRAALAEQERL